MPATSASGRSSRPAASGSRSGASSQRPRSGRSGCVETTSARSCSWESGGAPLRLSGSIWLAIAFVIGGAAGNGSVVVCNRLLVQRGAPDQYRGRALATIMSSNYAVVGLAMAAAGVLTDVVGARAVWIAAGGLYLFAAGVALVMTRWLPVAQEDEWSAVEASSESAVAALGNGRAEPVAVQEAANGAHEPPLERIATLLEEIEARREARGASTFLRLHRVPAWPGRS